MPASPLKVAKEVASSGTQTHKSTVRKMKERARYFETKNFIFEDNISDAEISDDELGIVMEESEVEEREEDLAF